MKTNRIQFQASLSLEQFLDQYGTLVTESLRLNLPQGRPIVLVIENFDSYPPNEQLAFAHLADGEERLHGLAKGSVLAAGVSPQGKVEPGTTSRGFTCNLT